MQFRNYTYLWCLQKTMLRLVLPLDVFCKTVYLKWFILPSFSLASSIRHWITPKANIQKTRVNRIKLPQPDVIINTHFVLQCLTRFEISQYHTFCPLTSAFVFECSILQRGSLVLGQIVLTTPDAVVTNIVYQIIQIFQCHQFN